MCHFRVYARIVTTQCLGLKKCRNYYLRLQTRPISSASLSLKMQQTFFNQRPLEKKNTFFKLEANFWV